MVLIISCMVIEELFVESILIGVGSSHAMEIIFGLLQLFLYFLVHFPFWMVVMAHFGKVFLAGIPHGFVVHIVGLGCGGLVWVPDEDVGCSIHFPLFIYKFIIQL